MADDGVGFDLVLLAAGVLGLAFLFRPAPQPAVGAPLESAFLSLMPAMPAPGALETAPELSASFDPAADLGTVTVAPFIEHVPGETVTGPAPVPPSTIAVSTLPVGTVRLNNGQYQLPTGELVGIPIAPTTVIESVLPLAPAVVDLRAPDEIMMEYVKSKHVIQVYPELADKLFQELKSDIARGMPGEPWFTIAGFEVWVKGHAGYTLSSGRQIAPGYITTEYGTPDNLPFGFVNDGVTVHYDPVLYGSLVYQGWLNAQGQP